MSEPSFDVTVFGATGFTGRLVAAYLANHAPKGTRWALAGRNEKALKAIRDELEKTSPPVPPAGIVIGSVTDHGSLVAMARDTRVVLTTVGPYADYGEPVVRACVEGGADYVDITGEPSFVSNMIDTYGDAARSAGLRIVHCCGFDSIPHDLGAYFTVKHLPKNVPLRVHGYVKSSGMASGGTWRSAITAFGTARDDAKADKKRRAARAGNAPARKVSKSKVGLRYEKELAAWAVPLPTIDPQIVLRSARALDIYGPDFRYGHFARVKHATTIAFAAVGIGAAFALAQLKPTRELLFKLLPAGDGPNEAKRAKSWFDITFVGEGGGRRVVTGVKGGDPGYGETSKMIAESALALALDRDRLPQHFGVLTPAVALGDVLLERLDRAGIHFRVIREELIHSAHVPAATKPASRSDAASPPAH